MMIGNRNHQKLAMAEQKGIESPEKVANPPNVTKLAKEMENESKSRHHLKETHGTSDDIDDETPVEEVKGPGVIQRVKEEVEAVVGAVLPKK